MTLRSLLSFSVFALDIPKCRTTVPGLFGEVLAVCNAYGHSWDCPCGFGGDTGGGRGRGRSGPVRVFRTEEIVAPTIGRERRGTVASYVNPNAHCPECDAPVFFYRSPYDGRVYFDALGWPWPKHGCTDRGYAPRHTQPGTKPARSPDWITEKWRPVLSMRVHADASGPVVTGDVEEKFVELHLAKAAPMDEHSPVFVRPDPTRPEFFEVTYLSSDPLVVHRQTAVAFDPRIRSLGAEVIASAAAGEPAANRTVGKYLLLSRSPWDAIPYLELAALKGDFEAQIELAVLLLFAWSPRLH